MPPSWASLHHLAPTKKEKDMTEPDTKILQEMAERAKAISAKAYCPYSKFRVGAVVLTEDGQMFEGCNVENASYGLTICAERNAVFQMIARAKQKIVAVVIYTPTPKPSAPCGACRQVINEFGPDALIMSVCDGPDVLKKKLSNLLPDAFGPANLK
jgi:cytidine deaminase